MAPDERDQPAAERPGPREEDFRAFADTDDVEALARYFDAAAPRLLLIAAHVAPPGVEPEDLVQQTFLEAIRARHTQDRGARALGWLASILRHRAIDAHRRRGRRPETPLDEAHDRADGRPSPDEALANDETFERVVAVIDALEPPQREVVSLRLVHGQDPATIAHTLGRKPSTVRMQLKRGLERLRELVPQDLAPLTLAALTAIAASVRPGLAEARTAVLEAARAMTAPGAASPPTTTPLFRTLMTPLPATLALTFLSLVAVLVVVSDEGTATADDPPSIEIAIETTGGDAPALANASGTAADDTERAPVLATATAENQDDDAPPVIVAGVLVDHTGTPVVGATIHWSTGTPKPYESGDSTAHASVASDADGAFELAADATEFVQANVTVVADGRPRFTLEIPTTPGAATVDLGTIAYPAVRDVTVQLVDADGAAVTWLEGERPYVSHGWRPRPEYAPGAGFGFGLLSTLVTTPFDASGRSTAAGAPIGGTLQVNVNDWEYEWLAEARFAVTESSSDTLELAWLHPDPSAGISIALDLAAVGAPSVLDATEDTARLALVDGSERRFEPPVWRADAPVLFEAVPDGVHRAEFELRGFDPAAIEGVERGHAYEVELTGAARVALRVLDANGGRITDYTLNALPPGTTVAGSLGDASDAGIDQGAHDLYPSVAALDQDWTVRLPDGSARTHALRDLLPGETRTVEIAFGSVPPVTGVVRSESGAPLGGVAFELRLRDEDADRAARFDTNVPEALKEMPPGPFVLLTTGLITGTTAPDGTFAVDVEPDAAYTLFVSRSAWSWSLVDGVVAGDALEIELPATRTIAGRVEGLDAEACAMLDLLVRPVQPDTVRTHLVEWVPHRVPLDEDGSFEAAHVGVGAHELALAYPTSMEIARANGAGGSVLLPALPIDTLAAGTAERLDLVLDAADVAPASVTLRATVDGEPFVHGGFSAFDTTATDPDRPTALAISLGDGGRVTLPCLPPGSWSLAVASHNEPWIVAEAAPRQIGPGDVLDLTLDVVRHAGPVVFVDAQGETFAGRTVQVSAAEHGFTRAAQSFTTDDAGGLELNLPTGTYTVRLKRAEGSDGPRWGPKAELLWTASGPAAPTLVLAEPGE